MFSLGNDLLCLYRGWLTCALCAKAANTAIKAN